MEYLWFIWVDLLMLWRCSESHKRDVRDTPALQRVRRLFRLGVQVWAKITICRFNTASAKPMSGRNAFLQLRRCNGLTWTIIYNNYVYIFISIHIHLQRFLRERYWQMHLVPSFSGFLGPRREWDDLDDDWRDGNGKSHGKSHGKSVFCCHANRLVGLYNLSCLTYTIPYSLKWINGNLDVCWFICIVIIIIIIIIYLIYIYPWYITDIDIDTTYIHIHTDRQTYIHYITLQ